MEWKLLSNTYETLVNRCALEMLAVGDNEYTLKSIQCERICVIVSIW